MQKLRIVIVGHVCIDHNTSEHATYTDWGSTALYMADYFQKSLGQIPEIITTYGPDFQPYTSAFHLHPSAPQAMATLFNENNTHGNQRIYHSHHTEQALPPDITPEAVRLLQKVEVFVLAPLLPNYSVKYVQSLLAHIPENALKVLNVQGYLRDVDESGLIHPRDFIEAADILPGFNLAVLSEDDHPQAFDIAAAWKKLAPLTNMVVTEGPLGASIIQKGGSHNIPTQPVSPRDIIDSVGCGDVFTAALAYNLRQTGKLESAIKAAHHAAREQLTQQRDPS